MEKGDKVVAYLGGKVFKGTLTGVQGVSAIIKVDEWQDWMNEYWNVTLDPQGCLVVRMGLVSKDK